MDVTDTGSSSTDLLSSMRGGTSEPAGPAALPLRPATSRPAVPSLPSQVRPPHRRRVLASHAEAARSRAWGRGDPGDRPTRGQGRMAGADGHPSGLVSIVQARSRPRAGASAWAPHGVPAAASPAPSGCSGGGHRETAPRLSRPGCAAAIPSARPSARGDASQGAVARTPLLPALEAAGPAHRTVTW